MAGFLRSFYSIDILSNRSVTSVASSAACKAVELGMLNLVSESYSIFAILTGHSDSSGPLTRKIPDVAQFLYEHENKAPDGVEGLDEEGLKLLEKESILKLPYIPEEVDIVNGKEEDFVILRDWIKQLESDQENQWTIDATTGYNAMQLSACLAGLLHITLHLNKAVEADEVMARITGRIHANQQAEYVMQVRKAWKKYFLSGWLRDKLGVTEHELKEYALFIHDTTKKRLDEGRLKPADEFKSKSFEEMLKELDKNTLRFKEQFEEMSYDSEGDEKDPQDETEDGKEECRPSKQQKYTAPDTIIRKPATTEQIAAAESKIGQPLPVDLKDFYAITNGTRPVIQGPGFYSLSNRLPTVQSLFWEDDDDYMPYYLFDLLPDAKLPMSIDWPAIEGGGIAMYEHDGQGTNYLWYIQGELLVKAMKVLEEAYEKAEEVDKKILDSIVEDYHGSWERLRDLKACWYRQYWGSSEDMTVFHDFRSFLSSVLFDSIFEEDKSPLKASEEKD